MLARKNNMLNSQTAASGQINEKSREQSTEARSKYTGSKETRKLTNRGEATVSSSRNQKSQFSNLSMDSGKNGSNINNSGVQNNKLGSYGQGSASKAISEFKPTPIFKASDDLVQTDDLLL